MGMAVGVPDAAVEVVEADLFATLDHGGYGSKDIRVACQVVPGIAGRLWLEDLRQLVDQGRQA